MSEFFGKEMMDGLERWAKQEAEHARFRACLEDIMLGRWNTAQRYLATPPRPLDANAYARAALDPSVPLYEERVVYEGSTVSDRKADINANVLVCTYDEQRVERQHWYENEHVLTAPELALEERPDAVLLVSYELGEKRQFHAVPGKVLREIPKEIF